MRRKLTLTIDPAVYEMMGDLPRRVSISEVVSVVLKAVMTDVKGMSDEEFRNMIDSDPRLRDVRAYLKERLSPFLDRVEPIVEKVDVMSLSKGRKNRVE